MFTRRPRTARELVSKVGRVPALAASATLGMAMFPALAWAGPVDGQTPGASGGAPSAPAPAENSLAAVQSEQPQADAPAIRDPMKSDKPAKQAPGNEDKSRAKVSVGEHMTVDLHLKDEDLSNVLELLSIQTQKNIVASKGVTGKVTATLYGVTFYQALDAILHVNGFGYVENGNFIFVYTNEELKNIQAALKKRVSKTITLNYLNADDAKEFITPLLSKDGGEVKVNSKTKDFNIPDKAPVGKNDYALGDKMVIFDYEENVKAIEELVKQLDTRPQQVLVEAMILQTSLNEANAFGVDFSIIGNINFLDFINTGGALSAASSIITGGTGAASQGVSPTNSPATAVTSTVGNTTGPGGFKVGVVAGDVGIFVRMLDSITDTVILSNPKILALNRQPARVLVGKRVGYLNTTQTETSTTQSVEFLDTGTQLYFRPFVSNNGDVRMELKPQVSSAEIRTITDSTGRAVTIPDEDTQEMVTNVDVRDGQTVVLGGLFTDNTTFTKQQVPWMGDIPILGAAFRGHDDSTVRSEIIFMITPTIVTDTMVASAAERASADIERVRAGTRQGLLSFSREKMTDQANVEAEQLAHEGKYDEALHKLQGSLSINPTQVEAYRLRDKITGMKEHWSDPSMLNSYLDAEVAKRLDNVPAAPGSQPHLRPWNSTTVPMEKAIPPVPVRSDAGSSQNNASAAISLPGQANALPVTVAAGETVNISAPGSMTSPNAPSGWDTGPAKSTSSPSAGSSAAAAPGNNTGSSAMDSLAQSMAMQSMTGNAPATSPTPGAAAPSATTSFGAGGTVTIGQNSMEHGYTVPTLSSDELKASDQVRATLPGLRGQIDLFSLMNSGQAPELGSADNNGWNDLVNAQLIKDAPANPYVGGPNASKVVIGEKPDDTFQTNYGWIFDPKTHNLWAAGFDSKDRPLSKTLTATASKPAAPANAQPAATPAAQAPETAGVETDNQNK